MVHRDFVKLSGNEPLPEIRLWLLCGSSGRGSLAEVRAPVVGHVDAVVGDRDRPASAVLGAGSLVTTGNILTDRRHRSTRNPARAELTASLSQAGSSAAIQAIPCVEVQP
jgi:hypothetical protein